MKLVRDAIAAGIFNDLGSGSNIDLCVITKDKVDYLRPYDEANKKGVRWTNYLASGSIHCLHSSTIVLKHTVIAFYLSTVAPWCESVQFNKDFGIVQHIFLMCLISNDL